VSAPPQARSRGAGSHPTAKSGLGTAPPIGDPAVAAVFESWPAATRRNLLTVRKLIFGAAAARHDVGPLVETLKWGQPAYLPATPRVGTTVRIDALRASRTGYAVYFHCQTNLVETFRELYPELRFSGNRAILLDAKDKLPEAELRHCVALALTYHSNRRKRTRAR